MKSLQFMKIYIQIWQISISEPVNLLCFRGNCHGVWGVQCKYRCYRSSYFFLSKSCFTAVCVEFQRRSDVFRNQDLASVTSNHFGIIQPRMCKHKIDINTYSHMSSASQLLITLILSFFSRLSRWRSSQSVKISRSLFGLFRIRRRLHTIQRGHFSSAGVTWLISMQSCRSLRIAESKHQKDWCSKIKKMFPRILQ